MKKFFINVIAFIPKVIVGIICVVITVGLTVFIKSKTEVRKVFDFLARGE